MSPGPAILCAALALAWCGLELWDGYLLVRRGDGAVAQSRFQAATFAGFLTIGFAAAAGAVP